MISDTSRKQWYWLGLCLPGLIPLCVPYLPFQDWPGHLGVVGVMLNFDDPQAGLNAYYEYSGEWKPNALLYWLVYGLAQFLSPMNAGRVVMALGLGGLGPAVAFLCRSVKADERLAFFVLPLAIGRHVYCGFIPNACALVLGVLALAFYFRSRERTKLSNLALLLVFLILTHSMHVFVYLAVAGLILASGLWDMLEFRDRNKGLLLAVILLSFLVMAPHLSMFDARTGSGPSFFSAITTAVFSSGREDLLLTFWQWLFASYRYSSIDDVLQGIWIFLLLGSVFASLRKRGQSGPRLDVMKRLGLMLLLTASMFVVLPSYIGPPVKWWGGNLRLPILLGILLIPLAGQIWTGRRKVRMSIIAFNMAVCLLALGDLWHFSRTEMNGFSEVMEVVPKGKKLTLLHWTPKNVHEYPGEPHGYASNYYLLNQGGFVPQNVFEHPDVPVRRKLLGQAPPWGQAEYFDWSRHGRIYDGYIVRRHPLYEHSPLHGINQTRVELVTRRGVWAYYRRRP